MKDEFKRTRYKIITINRRQQKQKFYLIDSKRSYITMGVGSQAPNRGVLASHCHESYTLGATVDRRRMNKEEKGDNGYRKRVSPAIDTQTQNVFIREF